MAEKLDPRETVDFKQLILSEVIQSEALIKLLEQKDILTRKELLEEVKRVAAKIPNTNPRLSMRNRVLVYSDHGIPFIQD